MKLLYSGKSKTIYKGDDDSTVIIKFRDTATAFNGEKKEELADKGRLNAAISNIIYGFLHDNGVKTHLIKIIDDTSVLAKKCDIIMVEVIVRNFAAGSFSKKYGVEEGTKLRNTTVEFCLKSDELGDPMINDSQITAIGLAVQSELDEMKITALKINELLTGFFHKAGIILADYKLEFGRCGDEIILCDEISPDSCRLWDLKTNQKLDKDLFRRGLGDLPSAYNEVLERIKACL